MVIYTDKEKCKNRVEYLKGLAEQYEVSTDIVFAAAALLGQTEDFDGLIAMLEDNREEELYNAILEN